MIPNFGQILHNANSQATSVEAAHAGIKLALEQFWTQLIASNQLACFNFSGTAIVGTSTVPVNGLVGSLNASTVPIIPSITAIQQYLASKEPLLGFLKLFIYTIENTAWFIDCKSIGYATPYQCKLSTLTAQESLQTFIQRFLAANITEHMTAMNMLTEGIKEMFEVCVTPVTYIGTGAGELTGVMTIKFT